MEAWLPDSAVRVENERLERLTVLIERSPVRRGYYLVQISRNGRAGTATLTASELAGTLDDVLREL